MISKRFEDITKTDIDALLTNGVPEGRTLDYKRLLPGSTDDEKREFLADVSSFANAAGGDILYGVEEEKGMATIANGLPSIDPDKEILRLDGIIRTSIEPRIPAIRIKSVLGFAFGPVMVLRVPKSWSAPHMVTFKGSSRFFSRTNAGKFQMDVTEIRSAFLLSEAIPERMKRFRDDRLAKVVSGETPVPLSDRGKLVVHFLPFSAFTSPPSIDVRLACAGQLTPIIEGPWGDRLNIDGYVSYWPLHDTLHYSYAQLFRSGAIESVDGYSVHGAESLDPKYEINLIRGTQKYLNLMNLLGIQPPIVIMLAMVGVKGVTLGITKMMRLTNSVPAIDRDLVLLPDVLVEDFSQPPARILKPIFDAVWQSAGHSQSPNYDQSGEWNPQQ